MRVFILLDSDVYPIYFACFQPLNSAKFYAEFKWVRQWWILVLWHTELEYAHCGSLINAQTHTYTPIKISAVCDVDNTIKPFWKQIQSSTQIRTNNKHREGKINKNNFTYRSKIRIAEFSSVSLTWWFIWPLLLTLNLW